MDSRFPKKCHDLEVASQKNIMIWTYHLDFFGLPRVGVGGAQGWRGSGGAGPLDRGLPCPGAFGTALLRAAAGTLGKVRPGSDAVSAPEASA